MAENEACDHVRTQQQAFPSELFRQQPDPTPHCQENGAVYEQEGREDLRGVVECAAVAIE